MKCECMSVYLSEYTYIGLFAIVGRLLAGTLIAAACHFHLPTFKRATADRIIFFSLEIFTFSSCVSNGIRHLSSMLSAATVISAYLVVYFSTSM